jgi:hypothetical protein
MLQRIIRILLKTHIRFGLSKSTIPRNVHQLIFRISYFHPQIENYKNNTITDRIKRISQ